jgi:hypothetical protein
LEFDACRSIAGHDQRVRMPPLTSAEADGDVCLIGRLPASGLGVRFPRGAPSPQVTALSL